MWCSHDGICSRDMLQQQNHSMSTQENVAGTAPCCSNTFYVWTSCTWHIAYYYSNSNKNPSKNVVTSHKRQPSVSLTFWVVSNSITELLNNDKVKFAWHLLNKFHLRHIDAILCSGFWPATDPLQTTWCTNIKFTGKMRKTKQKSGIT